MINQLIIALIAILLIIGKITHNGYFSVPIMVLFAVYFFLRFKKNKKHTVLREHSKDPTFEPLQAKGADEYLNSSFLKIKVAIENISNSEIESIYVISFFVYDKEDDPRKPTLQIGYNTLDKVESSKDKAGSYNEAKWNYAFWLQNNILKLGIGDDIALRDSWVKRNGLFYEESEESLDEDEDSEFDEIEAGEKVTEKYIEMLQEIVRKLHSENVIRTKFGKMIPVIIHELEYYKKIIDQNLECNPQELLIDFKKWGEGN
jgi:hypothetical protein